MARAMQLYHAHPSRSTRVLHFLYELQATHAELPPLEVTEAPVAKLRVLEFCYWRYTIEFFELFCVTHQPPSPFSAFLS